MIRPFKRAMQNCIVYSIPRLNIIRWLITLPKAGLSGRNAPIGKISTLDAVKARRLIPSPPAVIEKIEIAFKSNSFAVLEINPGRN